MLMQNLEDQTKSIMVFPEGAILGLHVIQVKT